MLKILYHGICFINDLNGEVIFGTFYEKDCKKQIKKSLELRKQSREKMVNYILNAKDAIICLVARKKKKDSINE